MAAYSWGELVLAWALIGNREPVPTVLQVVPTGLQPLGVSAASCFLWVRRGARMLSDEKQVGSFSCNSLPSEMSFHVFP